MKVTLKQNARVNVKAGETVEVSPTEAAFLISLGIAEEAKEKAKPKKTKE